MSKYKQIKINVTNEHYDELVKLSAIDDVSIASYIRAKLNIDLKNPPKRCISNSNEKIVIHKIDPMLLYHLAKIGNNINQIAYKLNTNNYDSKLALIELIKIKDLLNDYKY